MVRKCDILGGLKPPKGVGALVLCLGVGVVPGPEGFDDDRIRCVWYLMLGCQGSALYRGRVFIRGVDYPGCAVGECRGHLAVSMVLSYHGHLAVSSPLDKNLLCGLSS